MLQYKSQNFVHIVPSVAKNKEQYNGDIHKLLDGKFCNYVPGQSGALFSLMLMGLSGIELDAFFLPDPLFPSMLLYVHKQIN